MNMTVVPTEIASDPKQEITFGDFKALVKKRSIRREVMTKTLELMQENLIKLDEEAQKSIGPDGPKHILQAYYNEKMTLLAVVRCKNDKTRTPESIHLTSLDTPDHDNAIHVYKGPEDFESHMCAFYHNPVTNKQDWALDAGLLNPKKYQRINIAKIA